MRDRRPLLRAVRVKLPKCDKKTEPLRNVSFAAVPFSGYPFWAWLRAAWRSRFISW